MFGSQNDFGATANQFPQQTTPSTGRNNINPPQFNRPPANPFRGRRQQNPVEVFDDYGYDDGYQPLNDRAYHHRPTKSIDTWKIKFDGTAGELTVDEFVFRLETTARSTYTSFESLATGIHFLLSGRAAA